MVVARVLLTGLLAGAAGQAQAQALYFAPAQVTASCVIGDCEAATGAVLAGFSAMNMGPEDLASQLGVLAAVIIESAVSAPEGTWPSIAAALNLVADSSPYSAQAEAIRAAAAEVAAGNAGAIDTADPIGASPA